MMRSCTQSHAGNLGLAPSQLQRRRSQPGWFQFCPEQPIYTETWSNQQTVSARPFSLNQPVNRTTEGGMTDANLENRSEKVLRVRVLETSPLGLAYRCPVGTACGTANDQSKITRPSTPPRIYISLSAYEYCSFHSTVHP
jgi:hypothetical protein